MPTTRTSSAMVPAACAVCGCLILLASVAAGRRGTAKITTSSTYEEFRSVHRPAAEMETEHMFEHRKGIFEANKEAVAAHNAQEGRLWKMTVDNHFADRTEHELKAMLGYKRQGGRWEDASPGGVSFIQISGHGYDVGHVDNSDLAEEVEYTRRLNVSNNVHNQGGCGSCWAHAAMATLKAHIELQYHTYLDLSTNRIIDCTDNPRACGGTSGCQGATSEMAFENALDEGLILNSMYGKAERRGSSGSKIIREEACPKIDVEPVVTVKGFVRLPENRVSILRHAVATKGPVAASVDAGKLFLYDSGIFHGCEPNVVVNHAVVVTGYGKEDNTPFWWILNSWGKHWGDGGYMKMLRHESDTEQCGIDNKPEDGVFCKGAPPEIPVCGMCGIASDSAYPVGIEVKRDLLKEHGIVLQEKQQEVSPRRGLVVSRSTQGLHHGHQQRSIITLSAE